MCPAPRKLQTFCCCLIKIYVFIPWETRHVLNRRCRKWFFDEVGVLTSCRLNQAQHPCYQKIIWRRQWQATPVLVPGKSHGWRSLVGCSPWGRYESDAAERLLFHFSLSRNGEGNGNPLQCSCLENPRDGGAWWAAVYGVAQSRTRLMRLSSSSSSRSIYTREICNC